RQTVEGEHTEHGAERSEKNRALECDRDPCRPTVERTAADVPRITDHIGVPAHEKAAGTAEESHDQDDDRELRSVEADRFCQSMNRERRKRIDIDVSAFACGVCTVEQRLRIVELRDHAVESFNRFADAARLEELFHQCPSPSACACASGSSVRISKI